MLAKVIATAETRALAIARLIAALRAFPILGIRTNIPFLLRILEHPRFRAGDVDTGFLDRRGRGPRDGRSTRPAARVPARGDRTPPIATPRRRAASSGSTASDPWSTLRDWRGR